MSTLLFTLPNQKNAVVRGRDHCSSDILETPVEVTVCLECVSLLSSPVAAIWLREGPSVIEIQLLVVSAVGDLCSWFWFCAISSFLLF